MICILLDKVLCTESEIVWYFGVQDLSWECAVAQDKSWTPKYRQICDWVLKMMNLINLKPV